MVSPEFLVVSRTPGSEVGEVGDDVAREWVDAVKQNCRRACECEPQAFFGTGNTNLFYCQLNSGGSAASCTRDEATAACGHPSIDNTCAFT